MAQKGSTPAIQAAERAGIPHAVHAYDYDAGADSIGLDAATKLGIAPARVLKTLVVQVGDGHVVCVLASDRQLDTRALGKKVSLARQADAERLTGYVVGGISPLGQRKRLPTVVDQAALAHETVIVNGGRRGLQLELAPADLVRLTGADVRPITG